MLPPCVLLRRGRESVSTGAAADGDFDGNACWCASVIGASITSRQSSISSFAAKSQLQLASESTIQMTRWRCGSNERIADERDDVDGKPGVSIHVTCTPLMGPVNSSKESVGGGRGMKAGAGEQEGKQCQMRQLVCSVGT